MNIHAEQSLLQEADAHEGVADEGRREIDRSGSRDDKNIKSCIEY